MASTVWRTGVWRLHIVKRSDATGFEVLPKRWIVDCREEVCMDQSQSLVGSRLRVLRSNAAVFVHLAMIRIMLRRLAANASS